MRSLLLLTSLLAAACAAPLPAGPAERQARAIRLNVEPQESGEFLLTLENHARRPIGYNLCRSMLERKTGESWQPFQQPECPEDVHELRAGDTAAIAHRVDRLLEPGVYRYTTRIERPLGSEPVDVMTDSFVVE